MNQDIYSKCTNDNNITGRKNGALLLRGSLNIYAHTVLLLNNFITT